MSASQTERAEAPDGGSWLARPAVVTALPWVGTLARVVLAGVFFAAGVLKVASPDGAVRAVRAYQALPSSVVPLVGHGLPFLEMALAVVLLAGLATRFAGVLSALLLVVFVVGISQAWIRGLSIECGCFGGGGTVPKGQAAYLPEILRDTGLILLSALLVWRPRTRLSVDGWLTGPEPAPVVAAEPPARTPSRPTVGKQRGAPSRAKDRRDA